jgi:probable HAF family extracellular repeat protein
MISLRRFTLHTLFLLCISLLSVPPTDAQSDSVISDAHLTLTTIDVPGAKITTINGINTAGDMVGYYGQNASGPDSGFLYSNGAFTYFDYPGQTVTLPAGINDSGLIVGSATQNADKRFTVVAFLYDGTTFTELRDGTNNVTYGYGINNAGIVVGASGATLGSWNGFQMRNGIFKDIDFPGNPIYGLATGINNYGKIVGFDDWDTNYHAYIYSHGKFKNIDFPGAIHTVALGINDSGIVVGWYCVTGQTCYAYAFKNGKYISFRYPHARATYAEGINSAGQIVGAYTFDYQTGHGFATSPIIDADFERPGCCQTAD